MVSLRHGRRCRPRFSKLPLRLIEHRRIRVVSVRGAALPSRPDFRSRKNYYRKQCAYVAGLRLSDHFRCTPDSCRLPATPKPAEIAEKRKPGRPLGRLYTRKVPVWLSDELYAEVDRWQRERRGYVPAFGTAIRELVRRGLTVPDP
jgi:hypothetical protein